MYCMYWSIILNNRGVKVGSWIFSPSFFSVNVVQTYRQSYQESCYKSHLWKFQLNTVPLMRYQQKTVTVFSKRTCKILPLVRWQRVPHRRPHPNGPKRVPKRTPRTSWSPKLAVKGVFSLSSSFFFFFFFLFFPLSILRGNSDEITKV